MRSLARTHRNETVVKGNHYLEANDEDFSSLVGFVGDEILIALFEE